MEKLDRIPVTLFLALSLAWVGCHRSHRVQPQGPHPEPAGAAAPAPQRPWALHGFRDEETCDPPTPPPNSNG
jgi:hypothetical protein